MEVLFSHDSHNRIGVEEGSVAKVFGDSTTFSISLDGTTGQAFINLESRIEKTPKTITIVTSSGYVQDFLIISRDGGGEHIKIRENPADEEEAFIPNTIDFQTITVDLLSAIILGETPTGYGRREATSQDTLNLPKPLHAKTLYALEGAYEQIIAYEIHNVSKQKFHLETTTLKSARDSWVFLTNPDLNGRGGKTLCLICTPKESFHE